MKEFVVRSLFYHKKNRTLQSVDLEAQSVIDIVENGWFVEARGRGVHPAVISPPSEMIKNFEHILVKIVNVEAPNDN